MLILISRVAGGYFVDALDHEGVRPLVNAPVPPDEAYRLARAHGAADADAWAALADADLRWHRLLRTWDGAAVGGPSAVGSSGSEGFPVSRPEREGVGGHMTGTGAP